uniref:Uncharacterized protein n=1 Tax=Anopheles christyi TaxID=43041 RepID=A0A182JZH2_9DIPT
MHSYTLQFSLVMSKPFLGDLLARAIASSSTPDDPQSHISDFRMMMKMDNKADKLQLIDSTESTSDVQQGSASSDEEQPIAFNDERTTVAPPAGTTLWQRWNRTDLLARIIDDIVKPAHERITLVFQTLVPKDGAEDLDKAKQVSTNNGRLAAASDQQLNSTTDNDSDELGSDLELLQPDSEPAANGTTLLGQFQARRKVLRRRVAKALSSITGLLILAANTRREGANSRSTRSIKIASEGDEMLGSVKRALVELPPQNVVEPYKDNTEALLEEEGDEMDPRRNMETVGIFLLEVLGSFAGFSWGIFKQVQSFFWYAIS